ncbi:MAG: FKBP-type peptidyl-prolyl cis-trans isomerase [Actinobacteria bacterium]|nr:FKBP-type peptidyl-prolyl cis-trans isomerase [Actinomycetota bacterium]
MVLASFVACGDEANDDGEGRGGGNESTVDSEAQGCVQDEEIETDSGLKIEDIECGDGAEAEGDSTVVAHYVGTLENGTTFDSSRDGDPVPFTLGVGQLIPGFEEGIRGMKEGGVRKLTIPPELGYGAAGQGDIPPDSTLIFEIELISVEEADEI